MNCFSSHVSSYAGSLIFLKKARKITICSKKTNNTTQALDMNKPYSLYDT